MTSHGNEQAWLTMLRKLARFGVAGVMATLVHIAVAVACVDGAGFPPVLSNGMAFLVANVFSYFVHTYWSFAHQPKPKSFVRFFAVSLMGLGSALLISWAVQQQGMHYLYGIAFTIVALPAITFSLHNFWTYR